MDLSESKAQIAEATNEWASFKILGVKPAMYVIERSIWINRSPEAVFDFHADHSNRVAWHEHVSRSRMITPPPVGLGSRFEIDATSARQFTPMDIEIIAFNRPVAYSYRSIAGSAITDSHQAFSAENGGTRFRVKAEPHFRGLARLFAWFILKLWLERHIEAAVRELKEELEKE